MTPRNLVITLAVQHQGVCIGNSRPQLMILSTASACTVALNAQTKAMVSKTGSQAKASLDADGYFLLLLSKF